METRSDILNELQELSPTLFELKQKAHQPFKVPEGYFAQLQAEVFTSIELGFSENLGKNSFAVPNNYFEGLSESIMDAIEVEEQKEVEETRTIKPRVIELNSSRKRQKVRPLKIYAMAAAIAGLFLFMTFLNGNITNTTQPETTFSEAAIEYLDENFDDIESDDLFAMLDLSDESLDLSGTDLFQENLNEYLEENIDDLDLSIISSEI